MINGNCKPTVNRGAGRRGGPGGLRPCCWAVKLSLKWPGPGSQAQRGFSSGDFTKASSSQLLQGQRPEVRWIWKHGVSQALRHADAFLHLRHSPVRKPLRLSQRGAPHLASRGALLMRVCVSHPHVSTGALPWIFIYSYPGETCTRALAI